VALDHDRTATPFWRFETHLRIAAVLIIDAKTFIFSR
jgi:hypothetical protein